MGLQRERLACCCKHNDVHYIRKYCYFAIYFTPSKTPRTKRISFDQLACFNQKKQAPHQRGLFDYQSIQQIKINPVD